MSLIKDTRIAFFRPMFPDLAVEVIEALVTDITINNPLSDSQRIDDLILSELLSNPNQLSLSQPDIKHINSQQEPIVVESFEVDCECCFSPYKIDEITFCKDGHVFCFECARQQFNHNFGDRKGPYKCFSVNNSDCKYGFAVSELERFLDPKVIEGYNRFIQESEIKEANIDGFESCPFCNFGGIMINPPEVDSTFICINKECEIESCRLCNKEKHPSIKCEDVVSDDVLGVKHKIEEAMTDALLLACPNKKCGQKFFKIDGCNKMTCTCGTISCYVCKQKIADYNHFDRTNTLILGKCPLFDDTTKRNSENVNQAMEKAVSDLKQNEEAEDRLKMIDLKKMSVPVPALNPQQHLQNPNIGLQQQQQQQQQQLQDLIQFQQQQRRRQELEYAEARQWQLQIAEEKRQKRARARAQPIKMPNQRELRNRIVEIVPPPAPKRKRVLNDLPDDVVEIVQNPKKRLGPEVIVVEDSPVVNPIKRTIFYEID